MCVLLCANSNVRERLEVPLALAYRQALQLCPFFRGGPALQVSHQGSPLQSLTVSEVEFDEASQRRVMKRSAWLQAYWRYSVSRAQHGKHFPEFFVLPDSSSEWKKAFETIAKTWGRLLSLVGLRW